MISFIFIVILLFFSAIFAGAILGIMSLNSFELKRKAELGNKDAAKIYTIRKNGNVLLVTLIVSNVAVNSIIAVYLGQLIPGAAAVIFATLLITIFGEIAPMSLFAKYSIPIGAKVAPFIGILIPVLWPISFPLAWVLDKVIGREVQEFYSKRELIEIVAEHKESPDKVIEEDEEQIVRGALTFGDKKVSEVMTPKSVVITVSERDQVTNSMVEELQNSGFSRFPVLGAESEQIQGTLYLHSLVNPRSLGKKVEELFEKKVFAVRDIEKLDKVLRKFFRTRHHLFIVVNELSELVGVITIEDVLEEILSREIVGEFDKAEDMRKQAANKA